MKNLGGFNLQGTDGTPSLPLPLADRLQMASELHGGLRPINRSFYTRASSHNSPRGCVETGTVGSALNAWLWEEKRS